MGKIFYIIILAMCYSQTHNNDIHFLDMGVVIEAKNRTEQAVGILQPNFGLKDKNIVKNVNGRSVYIATTSDVSSSLEKINGHVADLEKSLNTKIGILEIENSRLRNQVVILKKQLNSELIHVNDRDISSIKPTTEEIDLVDFNNIDLQAIKEDSPLDMGLDSNNEKIGFDESKYASGVISYNKENYKQCIDNLKALPLKQTNLRTSKNILIMLADSYESVGRYKQAIKYLQKLSELNSSEYSDLVLLKQGIIFRNMGMKERAYDFFNALVKQHPESEYVDLAQEEIDSI